MMPTDAAQSEALEPTPTNEGTVSVTEAAQRLGVHEKTLRRWIRAGRVPADLVDGPYGRQYQVPVSALSSAQHVLDVVKVERPTDPRTLALAVAQAVHHEHEALRGQLQEDLAQLKAEVLAALAERPAALTPPEPASPVTVRKRWWSRLFSSA